MSELEDYLPTYLATKAAWEPVWKRMHTLVIESDLSDADVAELVGWKEKTVAEIRHRANPDARPRSEKALKAEQLAAHVPVDWEEATPLAEYVSLTLGWAVKDVYSTLRDAESRGLIESKTRKGRYMGKPVNIRTHYRKTS